MRKMLLFITMLFGFVTASFAQSDYYIKKAQSYQRAYSGDTRSLIPVISVHLVSILQYRWQS